MCIAHLIKEAAFELRKHRARKARSSGYSNTVSKDATVPQIAAQNQGDRNEITIKDAPVSDGSSGPRFSNGSAGSLRLCSEDRAAGEHRERDRGADRHGDASRRGCSRGPTGRAELTRLRGTRTDGAEGWPRKSEPSAFTRIPAKFGGISS